MAGAAGAFSDRATTSREVVVGRVVEEESQTLSELTRHGAAMSQKSRPEQVAHQMRRRSTRGTGGLATATIKVDSGQRTSNHH